MAKKSHTAFDGFKDANMRDFDSDSINPVDYVSTGVYLLDGILGRVGNTGRRGLGLSKIVEIFGENKVCKSELSRCIAQSFMKQKFGGSLEPNGVMMFCDQEHATDTAKFNTGISDPARATFMDVATLESFYVNFMRFQKNIIEQKQPCGLCVMDSLAACHTAKELTRDIKAEQIPAAKAQIHSRALSVLRPKLAESNTLTIFINQTRDKVNTMGNPSQSAGGKAIKFYADYRIEIRYVSNFWVTTGTVRPASGESPHGMVIEVHTVKNKIDMPMRKLKLYMTFRPSQGMSSGISPMWTTFYNLKDAGFIKVRGGRNHFDGESFEKRDWVQYWKSFTNGDGMPNGALLTACDGFIAQLMPETFEFAGDSDDEDDAEVQDMLGDLEPPSLDD
jgi:RecA/RadA recombinase